MLVKVLKNILEYNLIEENDNIVLGVSGGPDSMALLYAFLEIRREIPFNIFVAHVNHGVRGKDALRDELFVERKSKELGLKYYSKRVDMEKYARENSMTDEEAGRELRYGFFREILKELGGGKIAVAHNKNDQAETLLLRIMRGTGLDGLTGMSFSNQVDIIRPLLNISREEIEDYISINKIETVLDLTNLQSIYGRNKVRLEMIPFIEDNFNPNIIETLWRTSQLIGQESSFLNEETEKRYNLIVKKQGINSIIFNSALFDAEHIAMQNRIIRMAIAKLVGSLYGYGEEHINLTRELFAQNMTGKKIDIPGGLISRVNYDEYIIEISKEEYIEFDYILDMGENIFEDIGIQIDLSLKNKDEINEKDKTKRYFDFDKVNGKLRIRNRINGDKFVPLGMKGSKKIKDYFIDKKIPRNLRDKIPLLVDDDDIISILGYAIGHKYKICKETKRVLEVIYYNNWRN